MDYELEALPRNYHALSSKTSVRLRRGVGRTVAMFDRAPHEPFAEPPTIAVIRQFRLEAGTLVE